MFTWVFRGARSNSNFITDIAILVMIAAQVSSGTENTNRFREEGGMEGLTTSMTEE